MNFICYLCRNVNSSILVIMRKRKIPDNMPTLDLMPESQPIPKWNTASVISLLTSANKKLTTEERELLVALTLLIRNNLIPDDYDILFRLLSPNSTLINIPGSIPPIHHLRIPPEVIALIKATPDPDEATDLPPEDLPFTFDP